jgi:hypothetical protein
MRLFRVAYTSLLLLAITLVFNATAQAQIQQAFVSAQTGDDANPCTVLKPCRTFGQALSQVAFGGEVTALDSGDYAPFTIRQAVTVQAAPGVYAGVVTQTPNSAAVEVIANKPDVVVLRGLTLNGMSTGQNGAGTGISFVSGGVLRVESCVISGFQGEGISFTFAGELFVRDTALKGKHVANNPSAGIFPSFVGIRIRADSGLAKASIERSRVEGFNNGIRAEENTLVTIRDTVAVSNSTGFTALPAAAKTTTEMNLENCVAANNSEGIVAGGVSTSVSIVRVSNSTITNNGIGLEPMGSSQIISRGNNTVEGNTIGQSFSGTFLPK